MRIIHLTLDGYYAGTPLCSVNRVEAKERGEEFYHAVLWRDLNDPNLCQDCKREIDAAILDSSEGEN